MKLINHHPADASGRLTPIGEQRTCVVGGRAIGNSVAGAQCHKGAVSMAGQLSLPTAPPASCSGPTARRVASLAEIACIFSSESRYVGSKTLETLMALQH